MKDSNYMENMGIKKLALKTSTPMVISMIAIALYGITDSAFISNISEDALTTVALSIPMQAIITAIGLGTGIGINSILAKFLGEKDNEKAQKTIGYGFVFMLISWLVVAIISLFGTRSLFSFFTDNIKIQQLGYEYFSILGIFSIGSMFQILFQKILEAHGKTKMSMFVQFSGTGINLILDPLLIFGLLGMPALGIRGAAISTVIGQSIGAIIGLVCIIKNKIFNFKYLEDVKFDKDIIKSIYEVGFPTMLLEAADSFITLYLNKILIDFSEAAVSTWGVYGQLQKFVMIIVYGLNYGMIPIVAYNLGAKKKERIKECISFYIKLALGVVVTGQLLFLIIPTQLISIFDVSDEVLSIAVPAFRILSCGFVFAGVSLVLSATFQAFGNGTYSLIVNLSRKIIFVLPILFMLKGVIGIYSVWTAFTIAEIATMIVAIVLYRKISKKVMEEQYV